MPAKTTIIGKDGKVYKIDGKPSKRIKGTIVGIDGKTYTVKTGSSYLRRVELQGLDLNSVYTGQQVDVDWTSGWPVAVAGTVNQITKVVAQLAEADNESLENSQYGLRVKRHGIQLEHLNFVPSLEGHTHLDVFQRNGWHVDEDGTIFQNEIAIHPDGQISVGLAPDILKLDAGHATHRFWIGDVDPDLAAFSVTKEGAVKATSGNIAGWDILSDRLQKNDAELRASGELWLGTGQDVAVLSSVNPDYRLWIGAVNPVDAAFSVDKAGNVHLDNVEAHGTMSSANYAHDLRGWIISSDGVAEFNEVYMRGKVHGAAFVNDIVGVVSGQQLITDGTIFVADVSDTDETIDVSDPVFDVDDIIQVKPDITRNEWMKILSSAEAVDGGYRYEVERDLGGTGQEEFIAGEFLMRKGYSSAGSGSTEPYFGATSAFGDAAPFAGGVLSSGSSGGGYLKLEGSRDYGPYFGVVKRNGPTYDQLVDVVRIGHLNDFLSYGEEEYGLAVGDAFRHLSYSTQSGLELVTNSGQMTIDDDGVTTRDFALLDAAAHVPAYIDQRARIYLDVAAKELRVRFKDGGYTSDTLLLAL